MYSKWSDRGKKCIQLFQGKGIEITLCVVLLPHSSDSGYSLCGVSVDVPFASLWVFSGFSSFFPLLKNMAEYEKWLQV